jgi:hypothetical protein
VSVTDVVLVPSTPALLPAYAGACDPVAALRSACRGAVDWLVGRHPDKVAVASGPARADNVARGVPEPAGARVARHLLAASGHRGEVVGTGHPEAAGLLVVANGSATRSAQAPGHLDERAAGFDARIDRALREGDPAALRELDADLGVALWCHDVPALQVLGDVVAAATTVRVDYSDDPYGVQYWVVRWTCGS